MATALAAWVSIEIPPFRPRSPRLPAGVDPVAWPARWPAGRPHAVRSELGGGLRRDAPDERLDCRGPQLQADPVHGLPDPAARPPTVSSLHAGRRIVNARARALLEGARFRRRVAGLQPAVEELADRQAPGAGKVADAGLGAEAVEFTEHRRLRGAVHGLAVTLARLGQAEGDGADPQPVLPHEHGSLAPPAALLGGLLLAVVRCHGTSPSSRACRSPPLPPPLFLAAFY